MTQHSIVNHSIVSEVHTSTSSYFSDFLSVFNSFLILSMFLRYLYSRYTFVWNYLYSMLSFVLIYLLMQIPFEFNLVVSYYSVVLSFAAGVFSYFVLHILLFPVPDPQIIRFAFQLHVFFIAILFPILDSYALVHHLLPWVPTQHHIRLRAFYLNSVDFVRLYLFPPQIVAQSDVMR